ncbi:hypothetical protein VTK26DRAFT_1801 [Humicola hyalothermophila]
MIIWSPEGRQKVQNRMASMADGMFRWAQCQLDALEMCASSDETDEVLKSLPKDLPATYERILSRLRPQQVRHVRTVLVALAFWEGVPTMDELAYILRIDPRGKPRIRDIKIYWNRILTACSSLVSVSHNGNKGPQLDGRTCLRLAHFSVKEYLVCEETKSSAASAFAVSSGVANRFMAELCLSCLLHYVNVAVFGAEFFEKHPFTCYAWWNWNKHSNAANCEEHERGMLDSLLFEFLHNRPRGPYLNYAYHHRVMSSSRSRERSLLDHYQDCPDVSALYALLRKSRYIEHPLVLAARENLWRSAEMLLTVQDRDEDSDSFKQAVNDAVVAGVEAGAVETVLSARGVAPTLHRTRSNPKMAELLIAHGADPHSIDSRSFWDSSPILRNLRS